ncbi:hypothetical protein BVX99_02430 [bacterium F16]|nr:hypothetical protein BVX99_02430 [bacterium F16]
MLRFVVPGILSIVLSTGCTSVLSRQERAAIISQGHSLYLPILDYQVHHHVLPKNIMAVQLNLPTSEKAIDYIRLLSQLHPGIQFIAPATLSDTMATLSIKRTRRTGALVGEVFGSVSLPDKTFSALYYLKTGRPNSAKQAIWWVAQESLWSPE